MSSSAILLVNPSSGSYTLDRIRRAERGIQQRGLKTEVLFSQQRGDIEAMARESQLSSPEVVFVMGGDGTFNEAANGLVNSDVPLAFIPAGTTNVLARELRIPDHIEGAVDKALKGNKKKISLGKATRDGKVRYFIMMAGIGFDAATVYALNAKMKGIAGKGAYIMSGLKILMNYDPAPVSIQYEGTETTGYTVIVGNGSHYGGKFRVTPDASLFSPYFYVYVLKKRSKLSILKTALKLLNGSHIRSKDVSYFRTEALHIEGASHIQVDGDYLGILPVEITIEREGLTLLH